MSQRSRRQGRRRLNQPFVLLSAIVALFFLVLAPVSARQSTPAASPSAAAGVATAAEWLASQGGEDGSFAGFDGEPDPGVTADVVIALAAARNAGVAVDLTVFVGFLEEHALSYAQTGPGQAAKLTLAIVAAGGDPRDVATVNPVALISRSDNAETGVYGFGIFDHALIMLALEAAGEPVPDAAIEALRAARIEDGSWAFDGSTEAGAGESNTTAMVIQALVATGHGDDPMVAGALDYLKSVQASDGGFAYQPAEPLVPDANSTGLAVQALIAAGQDPASPDWRNAAGALAAFQNPSGAFRYNDDQTDDNLFATVQALPALAGFALPILGGADGPLATPTGS